MMEMTKEQIDQVFENAEHQQDYILTLYRIALPNFDELEAPIEPPECGTELHKYIFQKAIEFDRANHKSFAGGAWMNYGFTNNPLLGNWEVVHPAEHLREWTVMLLYPDYLDEGPQTYLAQVTGYKVDAAIAHAQDQATAANLGPDENRSHINPIDFLPLAVFPGHQDDFLGYSDCYSIFPN